MKSKKRISWMLAAFMVVGMLSGIQPFGVKEVMADEAVRDLIKVNQNDDVDFLVKDLGEKLLLSNNADTKGAEEGGFRAAVTDASFLITPTPITGDFSVEADIKVVGIAKGNHYLVGVGAFGGTGPSDLLAASVIRGNGNGRGFYLKDDGKYSAGSPKLDSLDFTSSSAFTLKLERNWDETKDENVYTAWINGESNNLGVKQEAKTSLMHLGLVISGAEVEVENLLIKQGDNIIFDLNAPIFDPGVDAPNPSQIEAIVNDDVVDIAWSGEDLIEEGTSYQIAVSKDEGDYVTIKSYTYADFENEELFEFSYDLTASGSYKFKVTGKSGNKESESFETDSAIDYILPLGKPELTVKQDSGTVFLDWKAIKEATSYDVIVMDEDEEPVPDQSIEDIAATSVEITDLEDGVKYKFTVTAKRGEDTNTSVVSDLLIYKADTIPTTPKWEQRIFGNSTDLENNTITINDDSVIMSSTKGKVSGNVDGIAFYCTAWDSTKGFQLDAKVNVERFVTNNQVGFGLMLRNTVGVHGDSAGHESNFVAAGAINQQIHGFYKTNAPSNTTLTRVSLIPKLPTQGDEYDLRIIKGEDNEAIVSVNGETLVIDTTDMFDGNKFYIGLFTSRDADVIYSDIKLLTNVTKVNVTCNPNDTNYLLGEDLNLEGLEVEAVFDDNTRKVLNKDDYAVTGYDKEGVGVQAIRVNYGGKFDTFDVEVAGLICEEITVQYPPAKTTYYLNDALDLSGMTIQGKFNSGLIRELNIGDPEDPENPAEYTVSGFDGSKAGKQMITVTLAQDPEITTSFYITVKEANLTGLEITKNPAKMLYYIGDDLDLNGMSVSAVYDDGTKIRLDRNEYVVGSFDTETAGNKKVLISHKEVGVELSLTVKVKELQGIIITNYPTTTYQVGDTFDITGLQVSKTYDNGDKGVLSPDSYTVNSDAFDSANAGVYEIEIVPNDADIKSIVYEVTVREKVEYSWDFITFGQSISTSKNYHEISDDGMIRLVAEAGAGKITGDHDGISFYYTEIDGQKDNFELSADIKVNAYAKLPDHDGQESFGIMARDINGPHGEKVVFASNIAAIGGYSGGTKDANGIQLFVRTGVESSDGAGSQGIKKAMLSNARPLAGETYRLTLAKTNSGYTGKVASGNEVLIYEPEILTVQDSGKIYVGFYTARLADIEVSNIELKVTEAASDAPRVNPPAEAVTPDLEIMSLNKVSKTDYRLILKPNVDGLVSIKQGNTFIVENQEVVGGKVKEIITAVTANTDTPFSIVFVPDDTQYLTSYDKIIRNFTVTMKIFAEDGDVYVSPAGTSAGNGTKDNPLDLDTAISFVKEGQKIIVLDGTYVRNSNLEIKKYNDGTAVKMKYLVAAPGANPVIDFNKNSEGVVFSGNYWHVKGIDFARSVPNTKGFNLGGSHNTIELCEFYEHGDTGLQISRTDYTENDKSKWPSYNLILNCTSFDNRDPSDNNADGFAAKLTSGEGNVFRGCIAHHNIDDAWDLYTKVGSGAIGAVTIEGCIAYGNGFLSDGTEGGGDKNGFKLGGEGVHVPHIIKNSLAYDNGTAGFTSNSNPGVIAKDNISFNNGTNLVFSTYNGITPDFRVSGFVSYDGKKKDTLQGVMSDNTYLYDGSKSANKSGEEFTADDFNKLGITTVYKRDENGNIIWNGLWNNFLQPHEEVDPGKDGNKKDNDDYVDSGGGTAKKDKSKPVISTTGKAEVDPVVGGTVGLDDVATVEIPSNALVGKKVVKIRVEKVSKAPAVEAGKKLMSEVYEFLVGDYKHYEFDEQVKITLSYDELLFDSNFMPQIHYYDEDIAKWISIGGSASDGKISVYVKHFTKFAVIGVEKEVEVKEFEDIKGHWAEDDMKELIKLGSIDGYADGTFRPQNNITRAEFTKILVKSLNLPVQSGKTFKDIENHWAKEDIETASYYGIVNGYDEDYFGPNNYITREQMATIIINAIDVELMSEKSSFVDSENISEWAKEAVSTAAKKGIISGYPDNSFKPKGLATRAEAVSIIVRILK